MATVARVTTITSRSTKSFEDAVSGGIERAASTLRNVSGAWVKEQKVDVTIKQTGAGNLVVSGTLTNSASGLYDFQSDSGIAGTNTINNSGTIKKSTGVYVMPG